MSIKLASIATVKAFIGEFADNVSDALIEDWIKGLSARLEAYLNRKLKAQAYEEYFDSDGRVTAVWVRGIPIDTGKTLEVHSDSERAFAATSLVSSSDYAVYPEEGRIQLDSGAFANGNRSIKVAYTGGYTEASGVLAVPDDLKQAFLIQMRYEWENRGKVGRAGESTGTGSSVTLREKFDLQPAVVRALAPFRRICAG